MGEEENSSEKNKDEDKSIPGNLKEDNSLRPVSAQSKEENIIEHMPTKSNTEEKKPSVDKHGERPISAKSNKEEEISQKPISPNNDNIIKEEETNSAIPVVVESNKEEESSNSKEGENTERKTSLKSNDNEA